MRVATFVKKYWWALLGGAITLYVVHHYYIRRYSGWKSSIDWNKKLAQAEAFIYGNFTGAHGGRIPSRVGGSLQNYTGGDGGQPWFKFGTGGNVTPPSYEEPP